LITRVFNINNEEEYKQLLNYITVGGSEDSIGNEIPLTTDLWSVGDGLIDIQKYYDEDGSPLWDADKYEFPEELYNEITTARLSILEKRGIVFPFVVIVGGEDGWDRQGDYCIEIFQETNLIDMEDFISKKDKE